MSRRGPAAPTRTSWRAPSRNSSIAPCRKARRLPSPASGQDEQRLAHRGEERAHLAAHGDELVGDDHRDAVEDLRPLVLPIEQARRPAARYPQPVYGEHDGDADQRPDDHIARVMIADIDPGHAGEGEGPESRDEPGEPRMEPDRGDDGEERDRMVAGKRAVMLEDSELRAVRRNEGKAGIVDRAEPGGQGRL